MKRERKGPRKEQAQTTLRKPVTKKVQLKPKKAGRLRKTQHRIALKKPSTRQLVGRLKRYWDLWDEIKRGELLFALTNNKDHQCSIRGLAKDLDEKEATLRRYIMLSQLPPEERAKFREGETAKQVLARKAARDRDQLITSRIVEEKKSGALSDEVADVILDFLLSKRRDPKTLVFGAEPDYRSMLAAIPCLLENIREITRGLVGVSPVKIRLPKGISLVDFYRLARPAAFPGEDWMERAVGWLANILVNIAPESLIREAAMNKAEERVRKIPSRERIEIRPDIEAIWKKRLKSLVAIHELRS